MDWRNRDAGSAVNQAEVTCVSTCAHRRALLVITDGNDNASTVALDQITKAAQQGDIVIYTIGLFGPGKDTASARHALDQLAEHSGGTSHYPASIDESTRSCAARIPPDRNQYTLAYTPLNQALDGSYRAIRSEGRRPRNATFHARGPVTVRFHEARIPRDGSSRRGHGALELAGLHLEHVLDREVRRDADASSNRYISPFSVPPPIVSFT